MTPEERISLIVENKSDRIIRGKYIDLHPYEPKHTEDFVRLRNQDKSRYNLNQKEILTAESQSKWYDAYKQRSDDINWCIYHKEDGIIGTIRLYAIDPEGTRCDEGGFIVDEAYAMSGPYALEAKILVFDFAFEILQISRIINETRIENKNMNSIGKRMGFSLVKEFEKNGVRHNLYELTKERYCREYLEETLERWSKRN